MPQPDGDLDLTGVPGGSIIDVPDEWIPVDERESFKTISHWWNRQALFEHAPAITDVRQVSIGDCFLLAPLHSIIQTDPDLIYGMMKDLRGGRVVVRFYDADFEPVYYQVRKTYLVRGRLGSRQQVQEHDAWWIHMLEKAYGVHRLRNGHRIKPRRWVLDDGNRLRQVRGAERDAQTLREGLTGGQCDDAFRALLGGPSERLRISRTDGSSQVYADLGGIVSYRNRQGMGDWERAAFAAVFGSHQAAASRIFGAQYDINHVLDFDALFKGSRKIIRREKLLQWFDDHYDYEHTEIRDALVEYIDRHVPGKRGTGRYTQTQLQLFHKIHEMLVAGKFVALGSSTDLGHASGSFGITNEHKVKGLAGPHAYQVVGMASVKNSDDSDVYFLKIRNPWLQYVRNYRWKSHVHAGIEVLSAAAAQQLPRGNPLGLAHPPASVSGESLLELSDLTKRFNKVYFGAARGETLPDLGELSTFQVH